MEKVKEENKKKITDHQLKTINETQSKLDKLLFDIGYTESSKHALLHELANVNKEMAEFKIQLEDEYGAITVNMKDGSYENVKEDAE
jgi:DNA polymerase III delta prime subunit